MKTLKLIIAVACGVLIINCSKNEFSKSPSTGGPITNDGGSIVGNGNNGGTASQGQILSITAQGTSNGQPTGTPVIVPAEAINVTCGQWISVHDLYNVRMRELQMAIAPLPPRAEDYPRERSGISANDVSLNRVCLEVGCGPALAVYTREYSSPRNNSVVRWAGDRWLKVLAEESNYKVDHKGGSEGLLCDSPGAQPPARIEKINTD